MEKIKAVINVIVLAAVVTIIIPAAILSIGLAFTPSGRLFLRNSLRKIRCASKRMCTTCAKFGKH